MFLYKGHTYISKREKKDIWQGLYEFVLVETGKRQKPETILKSAELKKHVGNDQFTVTKISNEYKHILSHQNLHARFFIIELKKELKNNTTKKVKTGTIHGFAFPRLIEKFLKDEEL
jgi:A/G-specific adenine glycosylase